MQAGSGEADPELGQRGHFAKTKSAAARSKARCRFGAALGSASRAREAHKEEERGASRRIGGAGGLRQPPRSSAAAAAPLASSRAGGTVGSASASNLGAVGPVALLN